MTFQIDGVGTAVPPDAIPQTVALEAGRILCKPTPEQDEILPAIFQNTGITKRHMVVGRDVVRDVLEGTRHTHSIFLPSDAPDYKGPTTGQRMREYVRHAGPLALLAAREALERAEVSPNQITHLITVSCTGFHAPGVDIELIRDLRLPETVERTHVGYMGCHGAFNGLRVAHGLACTSPEARVLMCAVELCSIHCVYQFDLGKMVAAALFGDGAGAVVGSAPQSADGWRLAASGSRIFAGSARAMSWTVGDHGFEMTLSRKVPALIEQNLRGWLSAWLDQQGLALKDVKSWCVHPGGPKILDAVTDALGLEPHATRISRAILSEFGNMSSATILFILERLMRENAPRPCVALGFGPGLSAEVALFR